MKFIGAIEMQVSAHMGHGMAMKAMHAQQADMNGGGRAVGHQARAAVAEAKEAGIDLPKNAQGMAASAIAQGVDPATVFAALVEPETPEPDDVVDDGTDLAPPAPADETEMVGETPDEIVETPTADDAPEMIVSDADTQTTQAIAGFSAALDILQPATGDEVALALLNQMDEAA